MNIKLSDHFTYQKLLRFTLPSMCMMIFTSIYGVIDGFFVSNFVGKTSFAAVNFIMPFLMVMGTIGFMFGTGGSALVSMTMGTGNKEKANRIFSMLVYTSMAIGVVLAVLGLIFLRPIASALGATGAMLDDCVIYGSINLIVLPAYILQLQFQSFFVTAEKPQLGLLITVAAGVSNIILDAVLVFPLGLAGTSIATAISQIIGGLVPLIYFFSPNKSLLRLTKTNFDGKALLKTCTNGSSELMSQVSMSLVGMLYNIQLLKYAGENGVAAYGVMMYANFIFISLFIGYSIGTAPIIGYHYGAENHAELKSLLRKSLTLIALGSVCILGISAALAAPLASIFVGYDQHLFNMTRDGFFIFSLSFLFAGAAIFSSGFFTALNDGLTSAIISFLRTLVFQIAAVLLLPLLFGLNGIWWSIVVAEVMAVVVDTVFLLLKRKKYRY